MKRDGIWLAILTLILATCLAWGQRLGEHHSDEPAVESASRPAPVTAAPPRLPADGRMTRAVRPASADRLRQCTAKRVAAKAINGDFGALEEWQRVGYTRLLENGVRKQTAWITHYWTGEPGVGTICASGRRVEVGRTAAMLHPTGRRPRGSEFGYFVLVTVPGGYQLRQVWDTGSPANARRARSKGAETWIDLYVPRRTGRTSVAPIWIEGKLP